MVLKANKQEPVLSVPPRSVDLWLLAAIVGLLAIGTVEIFSSSASYALKKHGNAEYFLLRQLVWMAMGSVAMWVGFVMDHKWLQRRTYLLLLCTLVLLVGVLLFGARINSARRWFLIGPFSIQPVELAKLSLVAYLSYSLGKKADKVKTFTVGFVPHLVVCAAMMGLLLKQPDLGSSIILGATTLTMLFVAGTKISYIALSVLASAPVAYHLIVGTSWRLRRFMAFFNPEAYRDGVAYQVVQSQISVGSGGITGQGIGHGRQNLGYMPEGHSDFIMSSVGEELGFVGMCLVLCLFTILIWRGIRAALGARDVFASYLAFGISCTIAYQVIINVGVVLGALPAKGLTLPFVSYGGSSLVMSMFLGGILLRISRRPESAIGRKRELINFSGAIRRKPRAIIKT